MTSKRKERTEFDERGGFAVVDEFFKNTGKSSHPPRRDTPLPTTTIAPSLGPVGPTHHNRRGVGAIDTVGTTLGIKNHTSVQQQGQAILRVGQRSKRRRDNDDDDDEDDNDHVGDHRLNNEEDDDEEEMGRTGIVKDTIGASQQMDHPTTTPTKKKKLGKKERQQQQLLQVVDDANVPASKDDKTTSHPEEAVASIEKESESDHANHNDSTIDPTMLKKKKKYRKKVRSKQKNIRKDHRDVKPSHLMGTRPMTAATRAKLLAPNIVRPA